MFSLPNSGQSSFIIDMRENKKIAFIGSVGSGKTTLIENLSDSSTINTDVDSSVDIGKATTTVGIDYGTITLDEDMKLNLYGVPGQRKFSFIWDFVKEGLWAVVILVKNNHSKSIKELDYLLDYFAIDEQIPCLIGITHSDIIKCDTSFHAVQEILLHKSLKLPVYSIDASLKKNAHLIIRTLIAMEEAKHEQ